MERYYDVLENYFENWCMLMCFCGGQPVAASAKTWDYLHSCTAPCWLYMAVHYNSA